MTGVAKTFHEEIAFVKQLCLFSVQAVQFSREVAESVQRDVISAPSTCLAVLLSHALGGFDLRFLFGLEGCCLPRFGGFSLGIPASADHVTRLSRDPSPIKAARAVTGKCLRALQFCSGMTCSIGASHRSRDGKAEASRAVDALDLMDLATR